MMILITGASGFIGTELVKRLLAEGHSVRVLSRSPGKAQSQLGGVSVYHWSPETEVAPATALDGVDGVIHLAGENIASGRWTENRKRRILDSRWLGTKNLALGISRMAKKPVLVSTSAVGFYGDRDGEILTEGSSNGTGFLAGVCRVWEEEAVQAPASRLVILRCGFVIGPGGGLEKLVSVFKAGIGGKIGDGRQWVAWIHRDDLVSLYLQALTDSKMSGIYNAVAPEPVQNEEFSRELARALHRPSLLTVPAFALKLAYGEMAEETVLASQRVAPERLLASHFPYRYPKLGQAFASALEQSR